MAEINDLTIVDASNTARFPENMAPSAVNNGARALEGIIARGLKDTIDGYVTTGGTSTAYTLAANRTISAYHDGLTQAVEWHTGSGASPTINIDSVGAKSLVWPDQTAVASGDLTAGARAWVQYDSGNDNFMVLNHPGQVPTTLIKDNAVTLAKLEDGTQGDVLYYGASGAPARLGAGTSGQVLQTQGAGANPQWADAPAFTGFSEVEVVPKTSDETVNDSTTLQNDDELLAALAANEKVDFEAVILYNSGTAPDIKFAFTVPTGASIYWQDASRMDQFAAITSSGGARSVSGFSADAIVILKGVVLNGANAGNLQLQWAQDTQVASDTKVLTGSRLKLWRE